MRQGREIKLKEKDEVMSLDSTVPDSSYQQCLCSLLLVSPSHLHTSPSGYKNCYQASFNIWVVILTCGHLNSCLIGIAIQGYAPSRRNCSNRDQCGGRFPDGSSAAVSEPSRQV